MHLKFDFYRGMYHSYSSRCSTPRTVPSFISLSHNSSKFRIPFLKSSLPASAADLTTNPARFDTSLTYPVIRPVPMMQSSSTWKPQTDKPYMCSSCGKGLSHIFTLNRHRKTVCGKVRNTSGNWKCERCSRSYRTEGNLTRHTRFECGVPRQFYCVFCNRHFTQRCSLIRHLRKFHKESSDAQREVDSASIDSATYLSGSESVRSST